MNRTSKILLSLCLLLSACLSESETIVERWPEGNPKKVLVHGKSEDFGMNYHENGQKLLKVCYVWE